ncbi:exosortase/archaeosortase family protein [Candidatus Nanohalococcus occultus]|uniref:Exosortase/archaeosortase family protein n=1 Tax=Candidatus Nanohalococcus occultus TaxID=2978047 RepID=A0ABY8CDL0_9ARCH|nr:hypothetical protein SVXNc_0269 [Candidatus Nanohaloarchaeota archaeon SVXNc]
MDFEVETERQEKLLAASKFLFRLLVLGVVFRAIIFLVPTMIPLQKAFAAASTFLLEFLIPEVSRSGIDIMAGEWFRVTRDCTGWKSIAALTGISIASKTWTKSFWGKGVLLIAGANLLRIVTIIYLDYSGIASFDLVHGFLWRWGLTAVVLGYWIYHVKDLDVRKKLVKTG